MKAAANDVGDKMKCSTKLIGAISAGGSLAGLIVAVVGVVLASISMADKVPLSSCLSSGEGINKKQQDAVHEAQLFAGAPLVIGGILAFIGGLVGTWGGFTGNKRGLTWTALLEGFACAFAAQGGQLAWELGKILDAMCDTYKCGDTCALKSAECGKANVCCDCTTDPLVVQALCESTHSWVCDCASRKTVTLAFAVITVIFTLIASTCGCSATCLCQDRFDYGSLESEEPDDNQGNVVGQPVGNSALRETADSAL